MTKETKQNKKIAVEVKNLRKSFRIPTEQSSGIKQKIINHMRGIKGYRDFTPLDNISFEIEEGDFFGIVGRNGSGKSTLLKLLAGIYTPDAGGVTVNGSLVPFIELGVGFNPELTGRENVFLNGALLGFSRADMESMYDDIVEFAELGDFMDERLKNYSSGMQVRLAFSIAIRADGDILLLDEVLAVGDEAFQNKCRNFFLELKRKKKTVILVTHDMKSVEAICDKGILLDNGVIATRGSNEKIAMAYSNLFEEKNDGVVVEKSQIITDFEVTGNSEKNGAAVKPYEKILLNIQMNSEEAISDDIVMGVNIKQDNGSIVTSLGIGGDSEPGLTLKKGHNHFIIELDNIYNNGRYIADILLVDYRNNQRRVLYELLDKDIFTSKGFVGRPHSPVRPRYAVRVVSEGK